MSRIETLAEGVTLWGWFDDSDQTEPSHNPALDVPCPYCMMPITMDDVRTHSIMYAGPLYAKRSYFYRTHRTCAEAAKSRDDNSMDSIIFDAIAKAGD